MTGKELIQRIKWRTWRTPLLLLILGTLSLIVSFLVKFNSEWRGPLFLLGTSLLIAALLVKFNNIIEWRAPLLILGTLLLLAGVVVEFYDIWQTSSPSPSIVGTLVLIAAFLNGLLFLGALLLFEVLYYAIPIWKAYKKWEEQRRDAIVPNLSSKTRIEPGVITLRWTNMSWTSDERFLAWVVKIPSTKKAFWCRWEGGDPIFKKGDFVLLAHNPPKEEGYGYLIESPGGQKHRFVLVLVTDEDHIIPGFSHAWDTYGDSNY